MEGFRRLYGSSPLHLVGHVAVLFVAGWAIDQIVDGGSVVNWLAWFLGAALLHDLVLLPVYAGLDRVLGRAAPSHSRPPRAPAVINHLRMPAAISGILLLVYFPVILGYSAHNYRADTGHRLTGYTRNWLLITAVLFACSGLVYALRATRHRRHRPRDPRRERARP
jgi:hypothetical protein